MDSSSYVHATALSIRGAYVIAHVISVYDDICCSGTLFPIGNSGARRAEREAQRVLSARGNEDVGQ